MKNTKRSIYLPIILIMASALLTLSVVAAELAILERKVSRASQSKISSLGVAEAGVSYYLWHLAHNNTDYTDGNGPGVGPGPYGPYIHQYLDVNGGVIGTYSLLITPPANGSTVTTVVSTGTLSGSGKTRTVKALLGIPSFSQYALVTNSEVWFGDNESTNGPVHSNIGIHFDGTNNGPVSSASATYVPSTSFGGNGSTVHNGVWGTGGPQSSWIFPVPAVNFQNITADLQGLKTKAISNGAYYAQSVNSGWFIQFLANGTYQIANVTNSSINNFTTDTPIVKPIPSNGIIYANDNVWVEGTVKGRYTVVAATLPSIPSTNRNATVTNNITYTVRDGSDVLGLIGQNEVRVSPLSPDNLEIDAAMLAQNGRVVRPMCWNENCGQGVYNIRNSIAIYGAIGCFSYWNWTWVNGGGTVISGYRNTSQTYDTHLLYNPPPSFPLTGTYAMLSWRELLSP